MTFGLPVIWREEKGKGAILLDELTHHLVIQRLGLVVVLARPCCIPYPNEAALVELLQDFGRLISSTLSTVQQKVSKTTRIRARCEKRVAGFPKQLSEPLGWLYIVVGQCRMHVTRQQVEPMHNVAVVGPACEVAGARKTFCQLRGCAAFSCCGKTCRTTSRCPGRRNSELSISHNHIHV